MIVVFLWELVLILLKLILILLAAYPFIMKIYIYQLITFVVMFWGNVAHSLNFLDTQEDPSYLNGQLAKINLQAFNNVTFDIKPIQRLQHFLNTCSNPYFRQLRFGKLEYLKRSDQSFAWNITPLGKIYETERKRSRDFVSLLNDNPTLFTLPSVMSVVILLSEPGYALPISCVEDVSANQELDDILKDIPVLAPCRNTHYPWTRNFILIPDFYILFDCERTNVDALLEASLLPFESRKDSLYFSGTLSGYHHPFTLETKNKNPRFTLLDMCDHEQDESSDIVCNITHIEHLKNERRSHVDVLNWFNAHHSEKKGCNQTYEFHAAYQYLLSVDGFGAAWGRVPSILATGSVLFLQTQCEQWYFPMLKENQHYIAIATDLNDLQQHLQQCRSNVQKSQEMGYAGKEFAKQYFKRSCLLTYISQIIKRLHEKCCIFQLTYMHEPNKQLIYRYANDYFGVDLKAYEVFVRQFSYEYRSAFQTPIGVVTNQSSEYAGIENITHRIWITNPDDNQFIPQDRLENYVASLELMPMCDHIFWTWDRNDVLEQQAYLREHGVQCYAVKDYIDTFITKHLIIKLMNDGLYGFASNLIRLEVLNEKGGVYCDIGLKQLVPIEQEMQRFHGLFYVKKNCEIDVCAMGFSKASPFLNMQLNFIARLPMIPLEQRLVDIAPAPIQGITTSYGQMAMLPLFKKLNTAFIIGFLCQDVHFEYAGMRLWKADSVRTLMKENPNYFYDFAVESSMIETVHYA